MQITELMEELWGNILRDVSTDTSPDAQSYIWNDDTLVRYIADGQRRFCRKTHALLDSSTPAVTQIGLESGKSLYPLHASVIELLTAEVEDTAGLFHPVRVTRRADAVRQHRLNPPTPTDLLRDTGRPFLVWTDEESGKVKVYPTPGDSDAGATLHMRVTRLPLNAPSLSPVVELEVTDESYQLTILEWAAFRALRNHDADLDERGVSEMLIKASAHKKQFDQDVREVKNDIKRRRAQNPHFHIDTRYC